MEFWATEVKSGETHTVNIDDGEVLHLSQACLGEIKDNQTSESIYLHIAIDGKQLVLGTLNSERLPQQLFDLVFEKNFQLSHNWKNGSVYFYGYIGPLNSSDSEQSDSDEEDEEEKAVQRPISNGKQEVKNEEYPVVASKKDGKQKVKIVEPEKDKKANEDDSDSDEDDSTSGDEDSDEDNKDSSDSEDGSDEEEEAPKEQSGKKRPNESAIKTPANEKKAKFSTPQKTDGKKATVHVATPHPSKKGKTPANKSNQESPASASGGAHSCKSCNRNFKSDMALQSHNQAKHK